MEDSILTSTKKVLGISSDFGAFDLDIITHINSAFSVLNQLGVGPDEGFFIEDSNKNWADFVVPQKQLNMVRTYIYLKTRRLFDPPNTSFVLEAMNQEIEQQEWRLSVFRDEQVAEEESV